MTPHFSLAELTYTDHREFDNTPPPEVLPNLRRIALLMEQVRSLLGQPIFITSGYRSKQVNDAVGSKDSSQHRIGCAVDIRVPGLTPDQVVRAIIASGLPYDQVIREFDRWTHVSVPNTPELAPRRQALIIDKAGTRAFV